MSRFALLLCGGIAAAALARDAAAGPYAPAAGKAGSTAVAHDDPRIVAWASAAGELRRGDQDVSDPELGTVSWGSASAALGPADAIESTFPVVSLGDGGSITLRFSQPITNGAGADFAVFENGFTVTENGRQGVFLELAFVEVSSDGVHFFRFPSASLTPTDAQVGYLGVLEASDIHNLAGKYEHGFGTPFDLGDLAGASPLLDVARVTHVRIEDVVGSIDPDFARRDAAGRIINDPWSTPYETGGFDLDAVAVLHQVPEGQTGALLLAGGWALWSRRRRRAAGGSTQFERVLRSQTPAWERSSAPAAVAFCGVATFGSPHRRGALRIGKAGALRTTAFPSRSLRSRGAKTGADASLPHAPRASAFTLTELLVSLAIIAFLMVFALAGVQGVREKGEASQCTSNLRHLAAANLAYAAEHDGQYVAAQEPSNRIRWHGVRANLEAAFDPQLGPLAPYLGHDGRVKLCPTLRDALKGQLSFEDGCGGYGYNAVYIGGTPSDRYRAERLANVPHAARTVMFTDTAFPRAQGIQEYAYCEPRQWVDRLGRLRGPLSASVHFRHAGYANVAWCDGHVSSEPPSELDIVNLYQGDAKKWKIGWFGPREGNGYWRP